MEQKTDIFTKLGEAILSLISKLPLLKKKVIESLSSLGQLLAKQSKALMEKRQETPVLSAKPSPNFHEPPPLSWYEKQLAKESEARSQRAKEKLESLTKQSKAPKTWTGLQPGSDLLDYEESTRSDSSSSGPIASLTHNPRLIATANFIKKQGWDDITQFTDSRNRTVIQLTKASNTIKGAVEAKNYTLEEFKKMLKDNGIE